MDLADREMYSKEPYFEIEIERKRALLHKIFVPPELRGQGKGKAMFKKLLSDIPAHVEYIRLYAVPLGSGCTLNFWKSLGFSHAYCDCDPNDEGRILHLAVNGFELPPVESLANGEERHYIFNY